VKRAVFWFLVLFLGVFLVFPLAQVLSHSVFFEGRPSFHVLRTLVENPLVRESIGTSVLLGILAVATTSCIGVPLAFLFHRRAFPGRTVLRALFLLPMLVSPFVGTIGMRQILSRFGSLNLILMKAGLLSDPVSWLGSGFAGIAIMQALHLYPIMFLNMTAALDNFDASCEEASANLGASPLRTFFRVTFPLLLPGYFAAASIIFIWAVTDLGTPLVFEYSQLVAVQIFNNLADLNTNPAGSGLVVLLTVLTLLLFAATRRYIERTPYASQRGRAAAVETPLAGGRLALTYAALALLLAVSLLPHAAIALTSVSGRWFFSILPQEYTTRFYGVVFRHRLTQTGIANSLLYSGLSTGLDLVLGFTVGYLLARTRFRGRAILDTLAMLPLVIPGIVIAFSYFSAFSGTILDARRNPVFLIVLSYGIRRLPYLVRSTYSSFQQISESMEEASYNLGAGHATTFRRVVLPLVSPGLVAGGILVFAFSILEVSSSLILAYKDRFYPITKVIYMLAGRVTDGPYAASALGVVGMVLLGLCFALASRVASRRMGEFFRIG